MASDIEWLRSPDGTKGEAWNPITGCSPASRGCWLCYAAVLAGRGMCADHRTLTKSVKRRNDAGKLVRLSVFNGTVNLHAGRLLDPIRMRKGKRIFVNSMSDLFHPEVPFEFIAAVYGVMAIAEQHTFLVLTKRAWRVPEFSAWLHSGPGYMHRINDALRQYVADRDLVAFPTHKHGMVPGHPWPLPNVQLGFSAEDQPNWDQRSSLLPHFEAAVRWVSIEPQLDHIELGAGIKDLDWGVVGAESGPGARPYEVEWAMSAVRQFQQAKTPIFVKQLGPHPTYRGNPIALSDAKGCKMEEWTGALKTLARREFPT